MKMYGLRIVGGGLALGIMWIIGLVLFARFIPFASEPSFIPTDGMVIFTGGKTRVQTALSLFHQKTSKYLLISGANPDSPLRDIIGADSNDPNITLGYKAADTLGNAEETAAWVKDNNINTLRLITSNYHMPRSLFELRHLLPDVYIIPEPVITDDFSDSAWWRNRHTLSLVMYEYNKFLFSAIRHLIEDIQKSIE
jgi:uncharacterized SAM-binding protein YcdF (DUF218 family)